METAKKIRDGLKRFHGSLTRLSKDYGCTREWIRLVLDGKEEDPRLIEAAAKLWKELEMNRKEQLERAAAIVSEAESYALAVA